MIRHILFSLLLLTVSALPTFGQQRTVEGRGEEYHRAFSLEFWHTADHAKALQEQVALPHKLNMDIAGQHVEEMERSLENARLDHVMMHRTYADPEKEEILENHNLILQTHLKATEAVKALRVELKKKSPDLSAMKVLAGIIFENATKAASEHKKVMMKLGLE
ncbi:MAG: hypothetical protein WEB62_04790 [Bacteroidota bacterium]